MFGQIEADAIALIGQLDANFLVLVRSQDAQQLLDGAAGQRDAIHLGAGVSHIQPLDAQPVAICADQRQPALLQVHVDAGQDGAILLAGGAFQPRRPASAAAPRLPS